MQSRPRSSDPILEPFLAARDEAEARRVLDHLAGQLVPVIQGIVRRKLRLTLPSSRRETPDEGTAQDLAGEVLLQVLSRLQALRTAAALEPIESLRSFAAVSAYRACDTYLRKKYPQRTSLRAKLLYLLTKQTGQSGLALWEGPDGGSWSGFEAWRGQAREARQAGRYQRLLDDPRRCGAEALPREDPTRVNPAVLLAALFNWVGAPIELEDLVRIVAELWDVKDQPVRSREARDEEDPDPYATVADPREDVARQVEQKAYLQAVWGEIRQLPPRQCAALLLNLRDAQGRGVIALLPVYGIATLREMAAALEMTAERFAELWNDLPIEDAQVAELLGCTRQQVINLRKVARERLQRRLRGGDE